MEIRMMRITTPLKPMEMGGSNDWDNKRRTVWRTNSIRGWMQVIRISTTLEGMDMND